MARLTMLLAIFSAVFFVVLLSEPAQSTSLGLPPVRLAQYLHLQKTLEGKKKRSALPDAESFKRTTSSKHVDQHESYHAHGDHVHVESDSKCGAAEHELKMREQYPELGSREDFEILLREKMHARRERMSKRAEVNPPVTLAVVVHVIHSGEAVGTGSNIDLDQIQSQIDVLNDDFSDSDGPGSNCQITFKLEQVNRVDYHSEGWAAPPYSPAYIDATIKPETSIDPSSFLNIWVMELAGGLLGYAQFPSLSGLDGLNTNEGPADTDGVVIRNRAFGTEGSATAPFDGGRTATHEIGHFLGLRHIWGDGAEGECATDYCDNTPPADAPNYDCPSPTPVNCGGTNQIQNYMDYTDDACMDRFMSCQTDRMYTVLENSPRRGSLIIFANVTYDLSLSIVNPESGSLCLGGSTTITPSFSVTNFGRETIVNATISLQIDSGTPTVQPFTFPGGLAQNATVTLTWPSTVDLGSLSEDVHSLTATIDDLNGGITDEDIFSNTDSAVFYLVKDRPEDYVMNYEGISVFPPTGWVITNGGWAGVDDVPSADGDLGISAVAPMYQLERVGSQYPMIYVPGFAVGDDGSTIVFDIAYAPYTNGTHVVTSDRLVVIVTSQCDDEEQEIYSKYSLSLQTADATGDSYVPSSSSHWRTESAVVSNSALFGKAVSFSFVTTTGYGNNLWIDNIRVSAGQHGSASTLTNWVSLTQ